MDTRLSAVESQPDVTRAMRISRIAGLGAWAIGWIFFAVACWLRTSAALAAFAVWYLMIAAIVLAVAGAPRKRQKELDHAWAQTFRELAIRDDLTGLFNRRYFNGELEAQIAGCRAAETPLSIALIDLNEFKRINDTFGHAAGDMALRLAGQAILDAAPGDATVARTGGDEFAVIMPGRNSEQGEVVAARIRRAIESANFVISGDQGGGRGMIRATVGVAAFDGQADPGALLHEADSELYARKRAHQAA